MGDYSLGGCCGSECWTLQLQPIVVGPDPGIGLPSGRPETLMDAEEDMAVVLSEKGPTAFSSEDGLLVIIE